MELFYPLFELLAWIFIPWSVFILILCVSLTLNSVINSKIRIYKAGGGYFYKEISLAGLFKYISTDRAIRAFS